MVTVGGAVLELVDVVVLGRVAEGRGGAAVQGAGGLIVQVLRDGTEIISH